MALMLPLRRSLAGLLALVMVLTSGAMAVARGNAEIGSLVVICTGHGLVTLELDRDGTPITERHLCPDCTLAALGDLDAPTLSPSRMLVGQIGPSLPSAYPLETALYLNAQPRAPPSLV